MTVTVDYFTVAESDPVARLDLFLAAHYSGTQSRSYFQHLISIDAVTVNDQPVKKRYLPSEGDEIRVEFHLSPESKLVPEPMPLDIIFEDSEIIVLNKPAGLVVHPGAGNWSGTLVNGLLHHCGQGLGDDPVRPGIVHRLDKETSGVIVAAKTTGSHAALVKQFAERSVAKEYIAVCVGQCGSGTIDAPIGRHPVRRKEMTVLDEGGKSAVTHFETLGGDSHLSVVRIKIETGRTHQIRVHMRHNGTPILGDSVYGNQGWNRKYRLDRQMLHAHCLELAHPQTGESKAFEALLPIDMRDLLDRIDPSHSTFL